MMKAVPKVNSLINNPIGGAEADQMRVRNSEYVGYATAKDAFQVTFAARLNPGNLQLWPWLESLSKNYDQWSPNGIVFEYRPTVSEASTTVRLGTILLSTTYDVYDEAPETKTQVVREFGAVEDKITNSIFHGVECDGRYNPMDLFYIRHGSTPYEGSEREYDLGTFYLSAQGSDAATLGDETVGELWVHYDITLCKKQSPSFLWIDRWFASSGVDNTFPLGVTATNTHVDTINDSVLNSAATNGLYSFPTTTNVGDHWLLIASWTGAAQACVNGTWAAANKCSLWNPTNNLTPLDYFYPFSTDESSLFDSDLAPAATDALGTNVTRFVSTAVFTITDSYWDNLGTGAPSAATAQYGIPALPTPITRFKFVAIKIGENP